MKRNDNFILRDIAGESILVPTGQYSQQINGLITLNNMAVFIWKHINGCENVEDMIQLVMNNFEGNEELIKSDVNEFINILKNFEMIE